ncbi:MAG: hypothetical protein WD079_01460, partial [Phycisphaeraceae bacterium]
AISNAERADQVMNIAEGGLTEVSSLLNNLQGLVTQSANDAGLSAEEKEANQLQIDSILQTIDRVAGSTSFQGQKLLNGNFSYSTADVDTTELTDVKIDAARIPQGGQIDVNVDVTAAAQTGRVIFDNTAVAASSGEFTLEISGNDGVQQFTFAEGATSTEIADAVNTYTGATGVTATVDTDDVVFDSSAFGSSGTVTVTKIAGAAAYDNKVFAVDAAGVKAAGPGANTHRAEGVDAQVNINGQAASVDGLTARVASSGLDVTVDISEALNTAEGASAFSITGGGATFQLSPELNLSARPPSVSMRSPPAASAPTPTASSPNSAPVRRPTSSTATSTRPSASSTTPSARSPSSAVASVRSRRTPSVPPFAPSAWRWRTPPLPKARSAIPTSPPKRRH